MGNRDVASDDVLNVDVVLSEAKDLHLPWRRSSCAWLRTTALLLLSLIVPRAAYAHPLHTTLTEITEDRAHGVVRATIRVFADDFGTAVTRSVRGRPLAAGPLWDAAALAYVASVFGFSDGAGRNLPVRSCGTRRTADLLWICVESTSREGLAPLKVRNGILSDLFDDQVNVVQGTIGGSRRSLLFTKGDRPKAVA